MVATDMAAQGLDIPSVNIVFNFDLPPESKTYIYRMGRTARAEKSEKAISLVNQYNVELWLRIKGALEKKINEYDVVKEEVIVLAERVGEEQRQAVMKLKDLHEKRRGKGPMLRGQRPPGFKRARAVQ